MGERVYKASADAGNATLGKTLPELLYEACARFENERAFNMKRNGEWVPLSLHAFKENAEHIAIGLAALGLARGDRIALFMQSDPYFCMVDMGCLIGGFVDSPIYVTHGDETIAYVLNHSGARALFLSSADELARLVSLDGRGDHLEFVISVDGKTGDVGQIRHLSLDDLIDLGRQHVKGSLDPIETLLSQIQPRDLATIIYTSGTTGRPKGVMLSHENITSNALAAFTGLNDYLPGPDGETVISFLPLTHVFARTLQYGFLAHASTVYYTEPDALGDDLRSVRPTIFATVPRLLEKVYTRIRERAATETGLRRRLLRWALDLAHEYDLEGGMALGYRIQHAIANRLVFSKWRDALGGRVKYIISGGAALNPELASVFASAGVTILQGYGLTETSPIISYNRPHKNRPATVGTLLPGVEVKIGPDGEILTRGPHVMLGYYRDPERTAETIDSDGWLHTGDVGEMSDDGFLRLTDRKKDLFKLSTGKYVMPQPLESRLTSEPLVEQVVVVGSGYKYSTALIFPDQEVLRTFARSRNIDERQPLEELLKNPTVLARYERLVDKANRGLDPWATIKRFALIPEHLSIDSGMLTPTMKVRRSAVQERYREQIDALYAEDGGGDQRVDPADARAQAVVL